MKLYDVLDNYLKQKRLELKATSIDRYKCTILSLKKLCPNLDVKNITTELLQEWINEWEQKYSRATIQRMIGVLRGCVGDLGKIKIHKKSNNKIKVYNAQELYVLDSFFKSNKIKARHLALPIARYTGLRLGEIIALQWKDVNFTNKLLSVNKNAEYTKETGMILQTPKTETSTREVPMPNELVNILHSFYVKSQMTDFIVGCKDRVMNLRGIQRTGELIFKKLGLEWKGFHAFRHTYATYMLEKDVNPKVVADLLGHCNIKTTLDIYSHTSNDLKLKVVDKVFEQELKKQMTLNEKENIYKQLKEMQAMLNEMFKKIASIELFKGEENEKSQ